MLTVLSVIARTLLSIIGQPISSRIRRVEIRNLISRCYFELGSRLNLSTLLFGRKLANRDMKTRRMVGLRPCPKWVCMGWDHPHMARKQH